MFQTVPLSIIRNFSLHTQQCYMSYSSRAATERNCSSVLILLASCQQTCVTYTISVCTVKTTPDDGQRNCPKHVEFYSKNKFDKLVHLVGLIIRRYDICLLVSSYVAHILVHLSKTSFVVTWLQINYWKYLMLFLAIV